jgi:cyclomaltodextrinase / maltogenic alpha-amylase / neopullulanase
LRNFRHILTACILLVVATGFPAPSLAQNLSFGTQNARQVPEWLNRATIYEVWLDAFSKEGNLRGAIARLPEVAELGASIVYLGPIAKRSSDPAASPYSIADYNEVDPEAGTAQDLRDFVAATHKLHLKVMLDIVYYHTAPDNVMMAKDREFFLKNPEGKIARGFWPQPLPDFNKPQVRKYLIDSLVHWVADFGIDGFRCDVGGGVPVSFWEEARQALDKVNREVILVSESDRPDDQLRAFDINYNFQYYLTLRSVLLDGAPASRLRDNWMEMNATMPRGARLLHYTDNHDWPRAVVQFGEKGAMVASVLDFTLDGIPFLYNGQEINDPTPTSWRKPSPIRWNNEEHGSGRATKAEYEKLFKMRAAYPELTSGEVVWLNNSQPNSVLSFLRKKGDAEILVIVNLSNRQVHVTVDLPVMDYYVVDNLITESKTWFQLYSGRVSAELGAFDSIVGKARPHPALQDQ